VDPVPAQARPKATSTPSSTDAFSGRHKRLLEITLAVPEARQALLDIARRNRQRQSKAELEAAYVLMRWLATHNPDFLPRRWTERPPTFNQKTTKPKTTN
jgi:hypothetical protein